MLQIGPDRRRNKCRGILRDRETEAGNRERGRERRREDTMKYSRGRERC